MCVTSSNVSYLRLLADFECEPGLARANKIGTIQTHDFWTVRDHRTVKTAGPSGFWTVRTVRTVQDLGPEGLQLVRTAKTRLDLQYSALYKLYLVLMEHKL